MFPWRLIETSHLKVFLLTALNAFDMCVFVDLLSTNLVRTLSEIFPLHELLNTAYIIFTLNPHGQKTNFAHLV